MNKKHIASIYAVAGQLDRLGHHRLADRLDKIAAEADAMSWRDRSLRELGGYSEADLDAEKARVQEGTSATKAGVLSDQAIRSGFKGPIEVDGKLFVYRALPPTGSDKLPLTLLEHANIGIDATSSTLGVISDLDVFGRPMNWAVKPLSGGDAMIWSLGGAANDPLRGNPGLFSHLDEDMQSRWKTRMAKLPGMGELAKPSVRTLPEDNYRAMSNVEVGAPGSKTRSSPRGHALLDTLILSAISLLVGAAAMFGFSRSKDDEQLKADLEATVDLLNKVKDKADPVKRQKSLEYTAGKVKLLKSKLGQPGYMADSTQKAALDKLDSQLDNLIASLKG